MSKRRLFAFSLILLMVTLLVVQCGPAEEATEAPKPTEAKVEPTEEPAAEGEPVTIRAIGFESCIMDGLQLQADAYMAENPNVTIELEPTAYTNLHEKQAIELSSGTGTYDIYSIVTEWMPEYTNAGFLEPLDDYIAQDSPEGWPNTWSKGLKFQVGDDGKWYGLPHHDGPQLLYYRKDLFEDADNQAAFKAEYGYDLAPPETWQQFLDIATFFTNPEEDMWGTVLTAKFGEQQLAHDFWLMLPSFGGGTGIDENGYPNFNSPEGVNTLQFYSDLINKYKVAPEASLTYGIPEAGDFYLAGKAAMHWNWAHIGAYAELEEFSSIIGKNGFTTMPLDEGKGEHAVYGSYWVLGIDSNSKNKDVAYDFIKFATDLEHDKLLEPVGCIPSRLSSWNDPDLLAKYPFYAVFQPSYEGFVTSSPRVPEYEKINDAVQRYMSQVLSGDADAQSALDAAAAEVATILEEGGHTGVAAPAPEPEEEGEPVTIRAIGFESCIMDGLQLQADAYTAENPNVTIELEPTAYTNLHEKQAIELSSGTGTYDIYSIVTEWMPEYTNAGFLEPLDDYIAQDPPEEWPNAWSKGLKFQVGDDGKWYGLPHHDGPQLLYYRKDLFADADNQAAFKAEYGYDLAPPETWQQFLDIATFFTNPEEDMWGTVLTAKFGEQQLAHDFWLMLPSFGGGTGIDENGYPNFNSPEGVKTLQFYSDLINEYKVAPEASLTYGIPEAGDFYLAGKAAMHWNWAHIGAYAELEEFSSIIGKNGFTTMPLDEGKGEHAVYGSYWVLGIDSNSKNKDVAYDFIKFATDPEHDKLLEPVGCIPSRLSSWNDADLLAKYPFYAVFQPSYEGFVTSSPRVPEYEKINDAVQRYMSQVLSGDTDAQSALDAAVDEITTILQESGHID